MAAISFHSKQYDRQQAKGQNRARQSLDRLYGQFCKQVARIGEATGFADAERELYLSDYPAAQKQLEKLLQSFASDITTTTREGIEDAWNVSDTKNNALLKEVGRGVTLPAHLRDTVRKSSEKALAAFLARKHEGMGLSERVWKVVEPLRGQMELALELGLSQGKSAAALSRDVRDYLLNPDKLFRRVRDKDGVLRLSNAAAGYHPGVGVYRSSYKNALRMTVTEANMAYRSADYAQWANMDFVLGIEVKPSGNHPVADICDELQGRYPKDFMFTGWHPWCRCFATPVLADRKEMNRWARLTEEERKGYTFSGTVTDVPQGFKVWVEDNRERAANSFSVPYFVKDNLKYLPDGYADLYATKIPYDTPKQYKEALKFNKKNANFSNEIKANNRELSYVLPVVQGKVMNFTEADGSRCNPHHSDANALSAGFFHNCQTCTMTYELRRRGFNVEAAPNPVAKGYKNYRDFDQFCNQKGLNWKQRWQTADGRTPYYNWSIGQVENNTIEAKLAFIEAKTSEKGRYEIYVAWNRSSAHVFTLERQTDGNLLWFDPQTGQKGDAQKFRSYIERMQHDRIGVLRVDDKLINPKFAKRLRRASK